MKRIWISIAALALGVASRPLPLSAAEVVLQYFGTPWIEIAARMPELAEAGYTALWLPPPQKASSPISVGFDTCDRFDLGNTPRNGLQTMYGTKADLLHMMDVAHRFGIRVYFDNIMAHTGGFVPSGEPYELNDLGFVPADFHILRRPDGSYHKIDWPDWDNEWQVLYRNPFSWDVANDPGEWNNNFGAKEGMRIQKWHGVRHPNNPEFYPDTDLPIPLEFEADGAVHSRTVHPFANKEPFQDVGYVNAAGEFVASAAGNARFDWEDLDGNGQHDPGEPSEPFEDTGIFPAHPERQTAQWGFGDGIYNMGNPVPEQVNQMLERSIRWLTDQTHVDGYRLDAIKHVRAEFFGTDGPDKDSSNEGYVGQIQLQHNLTHGFDDWDNHRDSVFVLDAPRNDAMLYGEHLSSPPAEGPYLDRGMRIANDWFLNSIKFNVADSLQYVDQRGWGIYNGEPFHVAHYVMSHDNNYLEAPDRKLAHAALLARESLAIVYTDGYNQSDAKANFFPKPAEVPYLGQFGETWMLRLLDLRRNFGWGRQWARGSSADLCAWSRGPGETGDITSMLFVMVRRLANLPQSYEGDALFPDGAVLHEYSANGERPVVVEDGRLRELHGSPVRIRPGEFAAFSWAAPEQPDPRFGTPPAIEILQNGTAAPSIRIARRDGPDGDPAFNPYGLPDDAPDDFAYSIDVPHVTSATNLSFVARTDGSAANVLMKLDGGIDLNAHLWPDHERNAELGARDNPPGVAPDMLLGFEQMQFVHRRDLTSADPDADQDLPPVFPFSLDDLARKRNMQTLFIVPQFNAAAVAHFPHNNWGQMATGLAEGFHVLRAKAFLSSNDLCRVPIAREFVQTFYLDLLRPAGRILPQGDGEPLRIRTDMTVSSVWALVDDGNAPAQWRQARRGHAGAPLPCGALEQEWILEASPAAAVEQVKLLEPSSSTDLSRSDEAGHFTTLFVAPE
jgi:glycosidase